MIDDSHAHAVRRIDWRSVFPATQLFRSFRVAIHPAKLALALAAILLVYTAGRLLDGLWPERYGAVPNAVAIYEATGTRADNAREVERARAAAQLDRAAIVDALRADPAGAGLGPTSSVKEIDRAILARRDRLVAAVPAAPGGRSPDAAAARDAREERVAGLYAEAAAAHDVADAARGRGVFDTFMNYEIDQVDRVAKGVVGFDWTGPTGVFAGVRRFVFTGPGWALARHPVHAVLLSLIALFVWSVFGGALTRLAAVHVARNEKISVRQALRFSTSKLLSFFAAPLMPLAIVGVVYLALALVGWVTEVPFLGGALGIAIAIAFGLLLFLGVLLACAVIGTVAGFGLMYPTIAVEGSDAFDAVSRSFSYVFARPWKVLCYSLLALVYAAVTYVVLRLVVYLTLSLLHGGLTAFAHHAGAPDGVTSFGHAWPPPGGPFELVVPPSYFSLTGAERVMAGVLSFWLYTFASLLAAYLLSFFVSASTIMYYLLRYDVDATQIDDVYLDPDDEDAIDEFDEPNGPTDLSTDSSPREPRNELSATADAPTPAAGRGPTSSGGRTDSDGGTVGTDVGAGGPPEPVASPDVTGVTARVVSSESTTTPVYDSAAAAASGGTSGPVLVTMSPAGGEPRADADKPSMPLVTPHEGAASHEGETPKPALDGDAPERQNPT